MNKYYDAYMKIVNEKKANSERLERSFGEQMKPVKIAGELGKILIHVLSFSSAVILPAYGFELMFGSFTVGLIIGAMMLLIFVEVPKWATINTIFENYFDSDIKSYGLGLLSLVLIAVSVSSSTFGVPIAVFRLSPDANLIDIESINNNKSKEVNKALAYWSPQIQKHENDSKEYFIKYKKRDKVTNEWRLSSSNKIRIPYNNMLLSQTETQKKLNNKLDSIDSEFSVLIKDSNKANVLTTNDHNFKKENAGFIAMWIMLLLEFSYILIVFGLKYYDDRSTKELKEPVNPKDKDIRKSLIGKDKGSVKVKESVSQPNTSIQFDMPLAYFNGKEGDIVEGKGKKKDRVMVEVAGELRAYTKGKLNNLIKSQSGIERIKHLETLKNKLA